VPKKTDKEDKFPNIEKELLKKRNIFICEQIDDKLAKTVIQQLMYLDSVNSKKEIVIWINSGGGYVTDGLAIIDTMKQIKSPITTVIKGHACSMAGEISINGNKRKMTRHSVWMAHDMAGGVWGDYTTKVLDRAEHLKYVQNMLHNNIKVNTKLNKNDLKKAQNGELWLTPEQCMKKGIVDEVI